MDAGPSNDSSKPGPQAGRVSFVSTVDLRRVKRPDSPEDAALARPLVSSVHVFSDPFEPAAEWDPPRN
jgi:hypothetical protein